MFLKYINVSNNIHVLNILVGFAATIFSDLSNVVPVPNIRSMYSQRK